MNNRERLICLLSDYDFDLTFCDICERPDDECAVCGSERLADYLVSNGVVVPPCNVGDTVYRPSKYLGVVQFVITSFNMYQSEMFFTDDSDNIIYLPDIGKTVFLNREEAEMALKEKN